MSVQARMLRDSLFNFFIIILFLNGEVLILLTLPWREGFIPKG